MHNCIKALSEKGFTVSEANSGGESTITPDQVKTKRFKPNKDTYRYAISRIKQAGLMDALEKGIEYEWEDEDVLPEINLTNKR